MTILLDKFRPLEERRARLIASSGEDPFHVVVERVVSANQAVVNCQNVIKARTNK
jgi:hypothetical protein